MFPGLEFTDPQPIVWAGVDDDVVDPAMATTFMAESPDAGAAAPGYQKWLIVADAHTGAVLYAEDQVQDVDVAGSVSARVTQGLGADICGPEEPEALPYARVNIGGEVAFADENGDFVIPNAGTDPVTVESPVRGQYFRVFNQGSDDTVLSMEVTPPGPADFMHNDANDEEHVRAEANAYLHANIVRDFALVVHPQLPGDRNAGGVHGQREHRVGVQRDVLRQRDQLLPRRRGLPEHGVFEHRLPRIRPSSRGLGR